MDKPLHVLVLVDRDWTHPEAGGTGTNLYGQISRWVAWGHRVTVVAGSYPGAKAYERLGERLEVHRTGTRLTVFPRAAWLVRRRGLARQADVTLEVINGIAFFTPLWLRRPRVALVHHVHRRMYVAELGRRGALAAMALETLPLRFLYRATPFTTISRSARDDLVSLGVPPERIEVVYCGVEPGPAAAGRAPRPTLLYLGRLKRYKRIEHVLDVLEAVPEAHLHVAGDGDHRPALEEEIDRRGLRDRVTMHGFVDEQSKARLYGEAWVALTASSAEGWCLTVMEAATYGTPSVALRVGGLPEAIVDGRTGALADTVDEQALRVREIVEDSGLRERLGEAARERARTFTWDRTAAENLHVLKAQAAAERQPLRDALARSDTAKALGLAAATMAANVVSLLFTIVFARVLGTEGYGSLAALVSTFLILSVPGLALQVAAARETALGRLGEGGRLSATHRRWSLELGAWLVALVAAGILLREPLAAAIGVEDEVWAAAAVPATGVAWLALSIERGMLQGLRSYRAAGLSVILEALGRLVLGLALVGGGLGVTGAYVASPLSMLTAALVLGWLLRRRLGPPEPDARTRRFDRLVAGAWAPVLGLTLVAVLQNIDVIIVKHRVGGDEAGAYAAAAVAAKVVIWVGIGLAYYLVPEAARRAQAGLDPRGVLARALAIVALVAAPMLAVYAAVPAFVLKVGFDVDVAGADGALVVLGAAMTLLAIASLAVQYMLAIESYGFMWLLALVAAVEPFLLTNAETSLVGLAALVLALQCLAAGGMLALTLRSPRRPAPALP